MTEHYGPKTPLAKELLQMKYLLKGETFKEGMTRIADALKDGAEHSNPSETSFSINDSFPGGVSRVPWGLPVK